MPGNGEESRLQVEGWAWDGANHHHLHQLLQKLLGTRVKRPKQETESRLENPTEECRLKKIYATFWLAKAPGGGGRVLPYKRLMEMCRWMRSLFHNWIDYNGVAFSIKLLECGRTFSDFGGKTVLHIYG